MESTLGVTSRRVNGSCRPQTSTPSTRWQDCTTESERSLISCDILLKHMPVRGYDSSRQRAEEL